MKPPVEDIEQRRPVWIEFSEFFLDTELDDRDHARIGRVLAESPYSLDELENILWREVYPVLISNLYDFAGDWYFDETAVVKAIVQYSARRLKKPSFLQCGRWLVRHHWEAIRDIVIAARAQ